MLMFIPPCSGQATEYVVHTALQISSVMSSQAQPGDTLTMSNGIWTDQHIVFQGNGTALLPILLRSQGGYGSVVLNGTSTLRIAGNYLVVDGLKFEGGTSTSGDVIEFRNTTSLLSNYCRLTNSGVIDYNPPIDSTDYKWVSVHGSHNRVDHCHISGKTHAGTTLVVWRPTAASDYHRIDHNYFGPRPDLGYNGGETIRIGTSDQALSSSFTTVEFNYFDRCNGEVEMISNKSCDNAYRYNTVVNCEGTITLRRGHRCLVEGNFFFGNAISNTGGIRIIGEDHVVVNNYISGTRGDGARSAIAITNGTENPPSGGYFRVKRALVAFNTLIDNATSFDLGTGKDVDNVLPPLDCIIANNVVLATVSPIVTLTDTPVNLLWQANIFNGASIGITPAPSGITIADPLLVMAGGDSVWRLSGGSPAIDSAQGAFSSVTLDMDGQPRVQPADIGADEYSTAPVTLRPLRINDVGPEAVSYAILVTQSAHGAIAPGTSTVRSGEDIRFAVVPDRGYRVDSLIIDGSDVPDSASGFTFVNVTTPHTIEARFAYSPDTIGIPVQPRWNLLSVPSEVREATITDLFPTAMSLPFLYSGTYYTDTAVIGRVGFWMKLPAEDTILIRGISIVLDSIEVAPGWNLVGSISHAVNVAEITANPPGLELSQFFKYTGAGYLVATTIEPGRGYWVKSAMSGKIFLTSGPPLSGESVTIVPVPEWSSEPVDTEK
jgi:poly(beta-D-mannuronate) lyase